MSLKKCVREELLLNCDFINIIELQYHIQPMRTDAINLILLEY